MLDKAKAAVMLTTGRAHVLRQAIMSRRPGGTISMNKGLRIHMGQCHVKPVVHHHAHAQSR